MVNHRHVRLTAGDLCAAVEDEGGGKVDGGQGRLGERDNPYGGNNNKAHPRLREPASRALKSNSYSHLR